MIDRKEKKNKKDSKEVPKKKKSRKEEKSSKSPKKPAPKSLQGKNFFLVLSSWPRNFRFLAPEPSSSAKFVISPPTKIIGPRSTSTSIPNGDERRVHFSNVARMKLIPTDQFPARPLHPERTIPNQNRRFWVVSFLHFTFFARSKLWPFFSCIACSKWVVDGIETRRVRAIKFPFRPIRLGPSNGARLRHPYSTKRSSTIRLAKMIPIECLDDSTIA